MYILYIYLNHFAGHMKVTQHCKSTALQFKKKEKKKKGLELVRNEGHIHSTKTADHRPDIISS